MGNVNSKIRGSGRWINKTECGYKTGWRVTRHPVFASYRTLDLILF